MNVNALLNSENIELPSGLVLTATRTAEGGDRDTLALTFEVIPYFFLHLTLEYFIQNYVQFNSNN